MKIFQKLLLLLKRSIEFLRFLTRLRSESYLLRYFLGLLNLIENQMELLCRYYSQMNQKRVCLNC